MRLVESSPGIWQAGSPDAPDLVLLHGWGGTGPANFAAAVETLAAQWHITAIDLPGHGNAPHRAANNRVKGLADVVAGQMADAEIGPAVVLGYSLGGAVAQHLWRDHRHSVSALVLAATAARLSPTPVATVALHLWALTGHATGGMWALAGAGARAALAAGANRGWDTTNLSGVSNHDGPALQLTASGVATFDSTSWVSGVDVPVAVVVARGDRLVPTHRQHHLAHITRAVEVVEIPGGHLGFLRHGKLFAAGLHQAVRAVAPQPAPTSQLAPTRQAGY